MRQLIRVTTGNSSDLVDPDTPISAFIEYNSVAKIRIEEEEATYEWLPELRTKGTLSDDTGPKIASAQIDLPHHTVGKINIDVVYSKNRGEQITIEVTTKKAHGAAESIFEPTQHVAIPLRRK